MGPIPARYAADMRVVAARAKKDLPSRALFVRAWSEGWIVALEGHGVWVLDRALDAVFRQPQAAPSGLAASAMDETLVFAEGGELRAIDMRTGTALWKLAGGFSACLFSRGKLWTAESTPDSVSISERNAATGAELRRATLEDPFGRSDVMLLAHPVRGHATVWLAAGQDGAQAFLVADHEGALRVSPVGPPDCYPPEFAPAGDSYLSTTDSELEHYSALGKLLGRAQVPWAEDSDVLAGHTILWLAGGYAAWASENGRIFILDVATMSPVDEIVIEGHPLCTVADLYPALADDHSRATDFEYSEAGPDGLVVSVHARSHLVASRLVDWSPEPHRVGTA